MFTTIEQHPHGDDSYDYIYLRNLHLSAVIGADAWDRPGKPQPVIFSLRLRRKISRAAASDNIEDTVSYGQLCKDITSYVAAHNAYTDIHEFTVHMCLYALTKEASTSLQMRTMLPKGSLRAEGGIGFEAAAENVGEGVHFVEDSTKVLVNDLKIACIIGVNAHERLAKQTVILNLQISEDESRIFHEPGTYGEHWQGLIKDVIHVSPLPTHDTPRIDPPS